MSAMIRVSGSSMTTAVAGAVAGVVRQDGSAEVQAIGAKAVNQAAKAIAIARVYLRDDGIDIVTIPTLVDVEVAGEMRTALRFSVIQRADEAGREPA
jgi:stage V sporulation protein S